jgi:hypothetical protein
VRIKIRYLTPLFAAAAVCASLMLAPVAVALPECTDTGPRTTQCQRPGGSTQIVTSPPQVNTWPSWGWPFGGFAIGFGF